MGPADEFEQEARRCGYRRIAGLDEAGRGPLAGPVIEILRLIGATRAFIRIPYFLEGAVLGACGSALALGMLKLGFELFRQQISSIGRFQGIENMVSFFPLSICVAFVAVGMGLGVAGSVVSLRRFGEGRG
ncbi:MAG: FtsX-like permease family protein [Nitrospira sp.]|nr:FtsX-like permease family protein [Nitrospira sp.]